MLCSPEHQTFSDEVVNGSIDPHWSLTQSNPAPDSETYAQNQRDLVYKCGQAGIANDTQIAQNHQTTVLRNLEDGEVGSPCRILDRVIVVGLPHALVRLLPVLLIRTSTHFILYL